MKRAPLAFVVLALAVALAFPVSEAIGGATALREPALCREMTPARMLEHPALAEQWAQALRSAQPSEVARVRAILAEIRAAHGCTGELAMPAPARAPGLPPGHPPIGGAGELPADHAPVPSSPSTPLFTPPDVVTI